MAGQVRWGKLREEPTGAPRPERDRRGWRGGCPGSASGAGAGRADGIPEDRWGRGGGCPGSASGPGAGKADGSPEDRRGWRGGCPGSASGDRRGRGGGSPGSAPRAGGVRRAAAGHAQGGSPWRVPGSRHEVDVCVGEQEMAENWGEAAAGRKRRTFRKGRQRCKGGDAFRIISRTHRGERTAGRGIRRCALALAAGPNTRRLQEGRSPGGRQWMDSWPLELFWPPGFFHLWLLRRELQPRCSSF